jgi:CBS domain-containing protein
MHGLLLYQSAVKLALNDDSDMGDQWWTRMVTIEKSSSSLSNVGLFLGSPVGRIMRSDVAILEADMTAQEALDAMQERNARNVLISTKGEVVGIVSKTDILFKVTSLGRNASRVRVREIMSSPVLAVGP